MSIFNNIFLLAIVLGVVWLTVGEELFAIVSGTIDYLMHPLERKLREARKISID